MHPAYSVIFFTVSSGAGYGLLIWLAAASLLGVWVDPLAFLIAGGLGLALVSAGLLSSTFHLGHPERSWRAVSQWRTSWLSREGVVAILSYPPALLYIASAIWPAIGVEIVKAAAAMTIALSVVTVICTGMIYASLKPIPRWRNPLVVPIYLALSTASGGLLYLAVMGSAMPPAATFAAVLVLTVAWVLKLVYWQAIDNQLTTSTAGSATGLSDIGEPRLFEGPHSAKNFVMREMGYRIGRKHAARLRGIAGMTGSIGPLLLILAALLFGGPADRILRVLAAIIGLTGILIERWLFFAEAKHAVTLYYGANKV